VNGDQGCPEPGIRGGTSCRPGWRHLLTALNITNCGAYVQTGSRRADKFETCRFRARKIAAYKGRVDLTDRREKGAQVARTLPARRSPWDVRAFAPKPARIASRPRPADSFPSARRRKAHELVLEPIDELYHNEAGVVRRIALGVDRNRGSRQFVARHFGPAIAVR
jgi:hypothetical protein